MTPKLDEARLRELAEALTFFGRYADETREATATRRNNNANDASQAIIALLDALSAERERGDRAAGLADYAAHDDDCTVNRYPGHDACSCGLSPILQSIRHVLATQKAEGA